MTHIQVLSEIILAHKASDVISPDYITGDAHDPRGEVPIQQVCNNLPKHV